MAAALTHDQIVSVLGHLADDLIAGKEELTQLDAALGDGDLGRTVDRGFRAIKEALPTISSEPDLGKLLYKVGKTFADSAASSFGALLGTAFMKGGMALKGKQEASLSELADAMQAALDALMERGKAQVGDKTMLDALHPAIQAMRQTLADGDSVTAGAALRAAAEAAQQGALRTQTMQSKIGRASWQGERSVGHMDPGARAVAMMLESAARHVDSE